VAGSGENLRVPIGIPVDTNASSAADAIAELRDRIASSKDAIRDAAKQMGDLKGKSAEVVAAKDQLRAKIVAEQKALSDATLKIAQHGTSYDKLREKERKAKEEAEQAAGAAADTAKAKSASIDKALGAVGGPVSGLKAKFEGLSEVLGGASAGELALAAGAAAVVAALAAVAAAAVYATLKLAKFIVVSADAARSQHLLRAAALNGNESWAKNLGDHVDELARKVPMARDQINEIGISLAKARIGGQTMVDTLNAVAQASSALGDESGRKLQSFVERGRLLQRFRINPEELIGTGVDFKDVAEALAKSMKIGVKDAQAALFEGSVKLGDGAKALRDAVEKKVGGINLRQMMSLENLAKKAGEAFDALAKDVNLEPALAAAQDVLSVFDQSTVTGRALKDVFTRVGTAIVDGFTKAAPIAKATIQGLIIGALRIENAYLRVRVKLKETFGDSDVLKNVDTLGIAMKAGEYAAYGVVAAIAALGAITTVALAPFLAIGAAFTVLPALCEQAGLAIRKFFLETDWAATGRAIIDGLVNGIKNGATAVKDAVGNVADTAVKTLREKLGIHSPSRVFAELGQHTAAGYAQGVDAGAPDANASVEGMVAVPAAGNSGGGARGGAVQVQVTFAPVIQVTGGGGSVKEQLSDPSLLGPLQEMFAQVLLGAGIQVPA
jgi:hypothetical protein